MILGNPNVCLHRPTHLYAVHVTHSVFAIIGVPPPSYSSLRRSRYSQRLCYHSVFAIIGVSAVGPVSSPLGYEPALLLATSTNSSRRKCPKLNFPFYPIPTGLHGRTKS
ncbi:hypothetical protein PGTUg99_017413 [Puccinia graminis f. sp. tritici]|uniref:Uncharacterized protein n=1 Tax=Puccinia graminis f. sp. tritici TaxID=56615 RepID=A0A5B0RVR2_PUCGR|nr:hypothetical protein PGTUg99_017413 [Puccinia graminis f. sp. tritici]